MGNISSAREITFVDVETTHLDPSKSAILSISIIKDSSGGKTKTWSTKIKPKDIELQFASPEALRVCGFNPEKWEDAPAFEEVADKIVDLLTWGPIVGHNIQFDIQHIKSVLKRYGYQEELTGRGKTDKSFRIGYPQIDTCGLAYLFLPTERQNLNALREHFNIDTERAHSADTDAEDCRTVFYNIIDSISLD